MIRVFAIWFILLFSFDVFAQAHCKVLVFINPDFCDETMVTLHAATYGNITPPVTYTWSTGATTQDISVLNGSGVYAVTIIDAAGCTSFHSVDLTNIIDFSFNIQAYNICPNEGGIVLGIDWHMLNVPINATYLWSTGETTTFITIQTAGIYSVTITDPVTGCSVVRIIDAQYLPSPEPEITGTMSLCTGGTGTLTVLGGPFTSYTWDPAIGSSQTVDVFAPGVYIVTVSNSFGCFASDTFEVLSSGVIPIINGPIHICYGESEILSVTNASLFNSFIWNTGSTASSISVNFADTYTVTATDIAGCEGTASAVVTISDFSILSAITPNTSCTSPNGSIDLTITSAGTYSFLWSNGSVSEDLLNVPAGSYSVIVTDALSCSNSAIIVVDNLVDPFTLSIDQINTTCNQSNGAVNLEVLPIGSYTFIWTNGAISEDLINIAAGTYTVTVTSASGCTSSASVIVNNINSTFDISGTTLPLTSCTAPNGSVDISVAPSGNYTYQWDNGATTEDITNLNDGTYVVIVTDGAGCSSTESFTVANNIVLPSLSQIVTNATCGQSNGTIDLSVNPAGSYTYIWTNGSTTQDLTNIAAGTYSVTVTNSNNCTAQASIVVNSVNTSFSITGVSLPNTSCTTPNGSIDITVSPTGTYTYIWTNGSNSQDLVNVLAGSYTVTVTDATQCNSTATFVVVDNANTPTLSITKIDATCNQSNGSVNLEVIPAGSYTYIWTNGSTTQDLTNIAAGTYSVTATNSNDCTAQASIVVNSVNTSFSITGVSLPNTSCTTPNGSIDITVSPTGTYTYIWTNGSNSQDLVNVLAGTYTVTVTDATQCNSTATFVVVDNANTPILSITKIDATCNQSNGSVNLEVIPSGSYTYIWTNGSTTQDLTNIAAGTYSVTATNSNDCTAQASIVVNSVNTSFSITGVSLPNTSCTTPNGSIDITVSPTGTYTYIWTNGSNSQDLVNVLAGTYTVTVTDATQCNSTATFVVVDNANTPILSITKIDATCNQSNGSVNLEVIPSGSYTYIWTNGSTTQDLTNIAAGTYSVTATNSNNCTAQASIVVNSVNTSFSITGVSLPNTSCTTPNGSIDITVSPTGTYTYIWTNGSNSQDLVNALAGSYTVTVTDATQCNSTATFVVVDNANTPILSITKIDATCNQSNGSVNLEVIPAGNYTYLWTNGSTTQDLTNIAAGTYSVTATNSNDCTAQASIVVNSVNTSFSITGVSLPNTSCTTPNGSIDITVSPTGTYTYIWTNGSNSQDLVNVLAGTYTVTVTDATQCNSTATFVVVDNANTPILSITKIDATCNQSNGSVNLEVIPAGSYTYIWTNGSTTQDLTNIAAGTYSVTATNSNDCTAQASIVVNSVNTSFIITGVSLPNTSCTTPNGSVDLTVSPTGTYTYIWTNGSNSQDLVNALAGTYTVTVTDATQCNSTATFVVVDNANTPILSITKIDATCNQSNGSVNLEVIPAGSYTYIWTNGFTTQDLTNIAAGTYSVTATNSNNCTAQASIVVNSVNTSFSITGVSLPNTSCTTPNGSIDITISPSENYIYKWSNGVTTEDLINVVGGTYSITVTNGICMDQKVFVVEGINNPPKVELEIIQNCGESANLKIHPNVSDMPLLFSIDEGLSYFADTIFDSLDPGDYSCIIKDKDGCTTLKSFTIENNVSYYVLSDTLFNLSYGENHRLKLEIANLNINEIDTIIWNPRNGLSFESENIIDYLNPLVLATGNRLYAVNILLVNGCEINLNLRISITDQLKIIVPNIIRNDINNGVNSSFTIYTVNGTVKEISSLRIFDRWGNLMFINKNFQPNIPAIGWDGHMNSEPVNPAVFTWIAVIKLNDGSEVIQSGDLTVIR